MPNSGTNLSFTVAMGTENGRRKRLRIGKWSFWTNFETCDRGIFIEHKQIPKRYFWVTSISTTHSI